MCGLTGFWDFEAATAEERLKETVQIMADTICHRGPDSSGEWVDPREGLALGHRRLAVIDLSPTGHQPMISSNGRLVISYNGEIYNFKEIRVDLESQGHGFRGNSDTEVLLAACEAWGVEAALEKCVGMFAFVLWDRKEKSLSLARDRIGEKPLYYGWQGRTFLFGSELKALRKHPSWRGEINRDALALFVRHNNVPAPYSIYKNIFKLQPGCILTLRDNARKPDAFSPFPAASLSLNLAPVTYWSARTVAEDGMANTFSGTDDEAVAGLEKMLRRTLRQQMVADVPLGAFLSGGIDSSTIVALMQEESSRPVKTFTIGFHEEGYNEAVYAKEVAQHLGTDHTELYVTPEEARSVIPRLPSLYDEPFADSSQIPTSLISELTRRHVTVSLSGDGGDEIFAGYNRYFWAPSIQKKIGWLPKLLRKKFATVLTCVSPAYWDKVFSILNTMLPKRKRLPMPGDRIHKLAEIIPFGSIGEMYLNLVSQWKEPELLVTDGKEPLTPLMDRSRCAELSDFVQRMMYLDTIMYLPDDILVKVDRAAMGVSLETRVPYLDHRVFEFAWRLPMSMKIRNGQGKWILRQLLYRYVPKELIERPKSGFAVPIDSWLRGSLRDWAEDLLDEKRLREEGFLKPEPVRVKWREHISGRRNWQHSLWCVLMFQSWLDEWGGK